MEKRHNISFTQDKPFAGIIKVLGEIAVKGLSLIGLDSKIPKFRELIGKIPSDKKDSFGNFLFNRATQQKVFTQGGRDFGAIMYIVFRYFSNDLFRAIFNLVGEIAQRKISEGADSDEREKLNRYVNNLSRDEISELSWMAWRAVLEGIFVVKDKEGADRDAGLLVYKLLRGYGDWNLSALRTLVRFVRFEGGIADLNDYNQLLATAKDIFQKKEKEGEMDFSKKADFADYREKIIAAIDRVEKMVAKDTEDNKKQESEKAAVKNTAVAVVLHGALDRAAMMTEEDIEAAKENDKNEMLQELEKIAKSNTTAATILNQVKNGKKSVFEAWQEAMYYGLIHN